MELKTDRLSMKKLDFDKRKVSISICSDDYSRIFTEHINLQELKDFVKQL